MVSCAKLALFCGVCLTLCIVMVSSGDAVAWEANVTFSHPQTIYEDTTYSFSSSVKNTGPDSMKLESLGLRFDWSALNLYYFADGLPDTIASGTTETYSWTIHMPSGITTNTQHVATIRIEAADPSWLGDWNTPTTGDVSFTFYVSEYVPPSVPEDPYVPPPPSVPETSSSLGTSLVVVTVLAVVATIAIVVIVILSSRGLSKPPNGQHP